MNNELKPSEIKISRKNVWTAYINEVRADGTRKQEMESREMTFGEAVMRYDFFEIGAPGENGYPLFIALHGGGSSPTPDMNDRQWGHMKNYYRESVNNGIYVAVRGVRDTWNTHFNPESYPLYDRLIENMIAFKNVDPNRVYIMGFSAGGDGVYGVVPCMTDRFAAASMSAGHPNGVSLVNLLNMPIILQCGELDTAYDRNTVTAEYGVLLDNLAAQTPGGYIHTAHIIKGKGHNFRDNDPERAPYTVLADNGRWLDILARETVTPENLESLSAGVGEVTKNINAVDFLTEHTRNPLPKQLVWNLATRAEERPTDSFYWLKAPKTLVTGQISACYDKENNRVTVDTLGVNGCFEVLLNDDMVDFTRPLEVVHNGERKVVPITADEMLLKETTRERGDYHFQFAASVAVNPK